MAEKQTAVEWLRERFHKVPAHEFGNLFAEAKKKEREQIVEAYNQDLYGGLDGKRKFDDGDNYYKNTYEK